MKRLFGLLLAFMPMFVWAYVDVGDWRVSSYDLEARTAILGRYLGSSTVVTVPNEIIINVYDSSDNKYKDVHFDTILGDNLFRENTTVVSVSLGNHSSIPYCCFYECSSLNSVSSDVALVSVGGYAFRWCGSLVSIPSLESVDSIGYCAFDGCGGLSVGMSLKKATTIGYRAFRNCSSIEGTLELPCATTIEDEAFIGCLSLSSVMIDNVSSMGNCVFEGCSAIEDAKIAGNTDIKGGVFRNCLNLRNVEFTGNTRFGDFKVVSGIWGTGTRDISPFEGCTSLEKVVLGCLFDTIQYSTFKDLSSLKEVMVDCEFKNIEGYAFSGCSALVSVPSLESVTNIGENAFSGCRSLESFEGFSTVINIGENAFNGCSSLKDTIKLSNVKSIGTGAFAYCSSLQGVKGTDLVVNLGASAFVGCHSLSGAVELPKTENVGSSAFGGCTSLTSVVAHNLKDLGDRVFEGCTGLESVSLAGDGQINRAVFKNCSSLRRVEILGGIGFSATSYYIYDRPFYGSGSIEEVVLGEGVGFLPDSLFNSQHSLTNVTVTSSLSEIYDGAFAYCSSLRSVKGADAVTKINGSAFLNCTSLESFEGFSTVTNLGGSAFGGCTSLTSVVMHNLKALGDRVFEGCTGLESVSLAGDGQINRAVFKNCSSLRRVEILGGIGFSATSYYIYDGPFYGSGSIEEVVLGEGVGFLPDPLFNRQHSLTNVTVTSSLVEIHGSAFAHCSSLRSVKGADAVTKINDSAFLNCTSLESFEGFSTVTNIGASAFSGCSSLTGAVELPMAENVQSSAFGGCTSLTSVVAHNLKVLGDRVFDGCTGLESVSLNGSAQINVAVFRNCKSLRRVEILGGIGFSATSYYIDNRPFYGSGSIEEVVLGEGVGFLPDSLFNSQHSLTNVTVTSSLVEIHGSAFAHCSSLRSVKGADSVTKINGSAFLNCTSLESFEGFSTVTNIGSSAFSGCSSLTGKVDLAKVITVGSGAFSGCERLRQVKFGKDLELVRADAFLGSTNLIAFTFEGLPPEADDNAFRNVKKGALGIYPTSTLKFDDTEEILRSVQTLSETSQKKEWCDVIAEDGTWKKLLMAANKPILTNDVYDVKEGSLQLNWENKKVPMPNDKEYGITYEIRRGFSDNYETADILTNGYDQLQYVDKQFDFTGGVSRIWYWVKPEHECTNLFERSDSCRTKNRYGVSVGFSRYKDSDVKGVGFVEAKKVSELAEREGKFEMMFLENERAFYLNVIDKIEGYNKNAKPGDVFFCFIATHGDLGTTTRGPSLRMYDSDGVKNRLYYEDLSRLAKSFVEMKARFIGVIQSCHSQAMVDGGKLLTDEEVTENLEQCGLRECGAYSDYTAWIVSASSQQTSFQYNFDEISLFSECFVENAWRKKYADIDLHIKGEKIERAYHGDGVVDFRELAEYVEMMYQSGNKYKGRINYTGAKVWNKDLMSRVYVGAVPNGYVYEDKGESLQPPENIDSVLILDLDTHKQTGKRRFFWDKVEGATRYRLYKTFSGLEKLMPVHVDFPYTTVIEDDNFVRVCFHNVENESCESVKCTYYVQSVNPAGISKLSKPHTLRYIEQKDYEKEFRDYLNEQGFSILPSSSIDEYCQIGNAILVEGAQSLASCFVTGVSPHDPNSQFTANITMENGKPKVTPNPDLGDKRKYTIYGKKDLSSSSADWTDMSAVQEIDKPEYRFFKVGVSLP